MLTSRDLLECSIVLDPDDGLPKIQASLSPALVTGRKPDDYIISTVKKLELMPRFVSKAKLVLKNEMARLTKRAGQDWEIIKSEMQGLSKVGDGDPDVVTPAVLGAIAKSKVMEEWFKAL